MSNSELSSPASQDTIPKEVYLESLNRLHRYAVITDSCFRIPFTRVRFGISPLVGLFPVVGDVAGFAMSLYVIREAVRLRAPRLMVLKMTWFALVEMVGGILPVVGDAFDVWFKANTRNLAMLVGYLEQQIDPPPPPPRRRWPWVLVGVLAFGVLLLWVRAFMAS